MRITRNHTCVYLYVCELVKCIQISTFCTHNKCITFINWFFVYVRTSLNIQGVRKEEMKKRAESINFWKCLDSESRRFSLYTKRIKYYDFYQTYYSVFRLTTISLILTFLLRIFVKTSCIYHHFTNRIDK